MKKKFLCLLIIIFSGINIVSFAQITTNISTYNQLFENPTGKIEGGRVKAQKVKGKISGLGIWQSKEKGLYFGDFENGKVTGRGVYIAPKGSNITNCNVASIYVGKFSNGKKQGKGRCYNSDGELIYEGEFSLDKPNGTYPSTELNNIKYFAEIPNDNYTFFGEIEGTEANGKGILILNNLDVVISDFKDSNRNGLGLYLKADGNWILEKYNGDDCAYISSSSEYLQLKKVADANFKSALSVAFDYLGQATAKTGDIVAYAQSIKGQSQSPNVYHDASVNNDPTQSNRNNASSGSKYSMSEQNSYNSDKSTYAKYDSLLAQYFSGNREGSVSEMRDYQRKMKALREKWESKGKTWTKVENETRQL